MRRESAIYDLSIYKLLLVAAIAEQLIVIDVCLLALFR